MTKKPRKLKPDEVKLPSGKIKSRKEVSPADDPYNFVKRIWQGKNIYIHKAYQYAANLYNIPRFTQYAIRKARSLLKYGETPAQLTRRRRREREVKNPVIVEIQKRFKLTPTEIDIVYKVLRDGDTSRMSDEEKTKFRKIFKQHGDNFRDYVSPQVRIESGQFFMNAAA